MKAFISVILTFVLLISVGGLAEDGGSLFAGFSNEDLEDWLCGEWLEKDTQFAQMYIEPDDAGGWDAEIFSPLTHGAYVFKASVSLDEDLGILTYDDGCFWQVPITDYDDEELGDPTISGSSGSFACAGQAVRDATLTWYDVQSPEEKVVFMPAEAFDLEEEANEAEDYDPSIPDTGVVVEPMPCEIDLDAPADGAYPAAFEASDISDGALSFEVFTVDCYDIVDINKLAVGDTIVIDGERLQVRSIERGSDVLINGGMDEGGYNLRAYDEDNCYKVAEYDDYPTWTDHGGATLPLAEDVVFTDSSDIERDPVTVTGADAVAKAIAASEDEFFDEYCATVTVEGGAVVAIDRVFTP